MGGGLNTGRRPLPTRKAREHIVVSFIKLSAPWAAVAAIARLLS